MSHGSSEAELLIFVTENSFKKKIILKALSSIIKLGQRNELM